MGLFLAGGCQTTPSVLDDDAKRRMLALLMPNRIEIVEPFTRVKSFDDDSTPDGIELLIQAVNSLDNPGLMIAGNVRIELYQHVPASANRTGKRLELWEVQLATKEHQRTYWNQITQMYEFRLEVDPSVIPLDEKYVLQVTYNSPLGEHLTDECILNRPIRAGTFGAR